MRLVSKRHDRKAVFPVRRKRYVFTNCSHPNHSGFFGGNFWWIKSTLTPAGASANWHERAEAEGRTCIFEETVQNLLLGVLVHLEALPVCRNIQSLGTCPIWPSGCSPDLVLSRMQEHRMVWVGLTHWVCLYQNTVPLMRSACHLLSKPIKNRSTVSVQLLMPSRWLLLIVP